LWQPIITIERMGPSSSYWESFNKNPLAVLFLTHNKIVSNDDSGEILNVITRDRKRGQYMLCENANTRALSIWIQFSTLEEIIQNSGSSTSWSKVGEINDAMSTRGIIGAQFLIASDKKVFVCFAFFV